MTDSHTAENFSKNLTKVMDQYQRFLQTLFAKQLLQKKPLIDPFSLTGPFMETWLRLWSNPERMLHYQADLAQHYCDIMNNVMARFMGEELPPLYQPSPKDARFKDKAWNDNMMFDFIKQTYIMTSGWLQAMLQDLQGLDEKEMQKVRFYTKQFIDALSPSNFALTNPEVLKTTLDSQGENLVKGMENLIADLHQSENFFNITTTDLTAFTLGKDLASTPGKVIFQNELMQLIHYAPLHPKHYEKPLLIIPPWINKYYILDMKPENSFVRWLLEQGHNVFMISWVNPDKKLATKHFEDYMMEGPLAALSAIEKIMNSASVNAIGYCLGGTLLVSTLAYMAAKKDQRIHSATLLTTLTDFTNAGELTIFVDEPQLTQLEAKMQEEGFFDGEEMATTFSLLRANDMIWSFVVNNYLLGKTPFPFDLLYWNADSTRLPAAMHSFYLRNMYLNNLLITPGGITLNNTPLDIRKITIPLYFLATKEDHIAPWRAIYQGIKHFHTNTHFTLTASGHIAGVINHPQQGKYSYWLNQDLPDQPEHWATQATEHKGSWWNHWLEWSTPFAGKKIEAKQPGSGPLKPIEDAPGSYVKVKYQRAKEGSV